jgi:hypothetical protein
MRGKIRKEENIFYFHSFLREAYKGGFRNNTKQHLRWLQMKIFPVYAFDLNIFWNACSWSAGGSVRWFWAFEKNFEDTKLWAISFSVELNTYSGG